MRIAIASGKGGTGKTFVTTNLAVVARKQMHPNTEVMVVDCDVEEPNAALFLKPTIVESKDVGVLVPHVDEAACTYCGRCRDVCVWHAIAVIGGQVLTFPELCHGCGSCARVCPENAISETLRVTGTVERGYSDSIRFAQGTLRLGEAMAPPVIRELKRAYLPSNDGLTLIDAPPGVSCSVVESLKNVDRALLVTEPTPFGLHDLTAAAELVQDEMGLDCFVVINRTGIGDSAAIIAFCEERGIPIVARIPHERRIAEVVSRGDLLVQTLPKFRVLFEQLFVNLAAEVES
jgi:MinD superfamily P-loop ATPase